MANFFGDLAKGLATGVDLGERIQRSRMEREEYEARKKDRADADNLKADLKAAGEGGMVATTDTLDARFGSQAEARDWLAFQEQNDPTLAANRGPQPAIPLADEEVKRAAKFSVKIPDALGPGATQQAALPTPQSQAGAVPLANVPRINPADMVVVQDPITHHWAVVSKSDARPMTQREIAERTAAVYRANGQPDMANRTLAAMYELEAARVKDEAAGFAQRYTKARLGGLQGLTDFFNNDFSRNNSAGVRVRVEQVKDGSMALHLIQPGSGATDLYLGPDGVSDKPVGFSGPELDMFMTGMFKNDLPAAYKDISDFRTAVQTRVIQGNQERREQEIFPLRKQGLQLDNQGRSLSNESTRFQLDVAGDPAGWSPRQARDIIAAGEEGVNGYNAVIGDARDGSRAPGVTMPANITEMTIGEVVDRQRAITAATRGGVGGEIGSSAVGRYQFVRNTLIDTAKRVFGSGWRNAQFSPANQDKLFDNLFEQKKGSVQSLVATWPSLNQTLAANRGALGGGKAAQVASGDMSKQYERFDRITKMYLDNGMEPDQARNAALNDMPTAFQRRFSQDQGIQTVSVKDLRVPATFARGLNTAGSSVTVDLPRSASPKSANAGATVIDKARAILRIGGEVGRRERQRFQAMHGMSPEQAIENPSAVRSPGRTITTTLPQRVTHGQLVIDANAALAQGAAAIAAFKRQYGQSPEEFLAR